MILKLGTYIIWQTPFGPTLDKRRNELLPIEIWVDIMAPFKHERGTIYLPHFKHKDFKIVLKNRNVRTIKWKLLILWMGFWHHCTIATQIRRRLLYGKPRNVEENIRIALEKALSEIIKQKL